MLKRICVIILSICLILTPSYAQSLDYTETSTTQTVISLKSLDDNKIIIDPTIRYQTLEGWGTSLAWWANACGNWTDQDKKNELLDKVFGEEGLGLNIARYNIGGSENPEHDHMRPGGEVPGYQVVPGVYDWSADEGQRSILQGAIDRGVNITEAFLNSPPYWMTYTKCTSGSKNGLSNNLYDDSYDKFADYITEVVKHFRDYWGITFRTVSPINEASTPTAWQAGGSQEGCHYDLSKQNEIMTALGKSLKEKGLSTQVSGPEENFIDWNIYSYNSYDKISKNYLKQLNVHSYHGTKREQAKCLAFKENKRLWMSEVSWGGSKGHNHNDMLAAFNLADGLTMDMKYLQPVAWIHWQVVEDEANNSNWGLIHANFDGKPEYFMTKAYYAFAQYTKFIRPGYVFISGNGGDNNVLAAYDDVSNKAVFVVKNNSKATVNKIFDLSKFNSIGKVDVFRTSPTENMKQLTSLNVENKRFENSLPSQSITTYVVNDALLTNNRIINDIEVGNGLNKMNFVGDWNFSFDEDCWDWDNHYTWTEGAYMTLPFYGTKVNVIGSKDLKFGKFAVSIDGEEEKIIDCYSPIRKNLQLLYQTQNLTRGEHILKIRVTGDKNFWSTASTINIDRVDIID